MRLETKTIPSNCINQGPANRGKIVSSFTQRRFEGPSWEEIQEKATTIWAHYSVLHEFGPVYRAGKTLADWTRIYEGAFPRGWGSTPSPQQIREPQARKARVFGSRTLGHRMRGMSRLGPLNCQKRMRHKNSICPLHDARPYSISSSCSAGSEWWHSPADDLLTRLRDFGSQLLFYLSIEYNYLMEDFIYVKL